MTVTAPDRIVQSPRFEWLQTLFCGWFTLGFFVDAYAHHNNVPESFFTPWHGLLYAGYLVASGHLVWAWLQGRKQGRSWSGALPVGYNGSLLGSLVFGAGGLGDMVWHIVFGIETDVEALFSPSHLLLGIGAVMMGAGPLRAAWRSDRELAGAGWRKALPPILSLAFVFATLSFFMQYNNPFTEVWSTVGGDRGGGSKAQIFMMDAAGNQQTRLTYDGNQDDSAPSVSPDGQRIAFMSDSGDGYAIHVMNGDGSNRQVLAQADGAEMYHPAWSPDGSRIAFVRVGDQGDGHDHSHDGNGADEDGDDGHLWLMKADGSDPRPLTNGARHDWQPAWSPDGTRIAFTSRVDGNEDVYVIGDGGGIPERVTEDASEDGNPSWSPDGNRIAFESDRDGDYAVFSRAIDGGEATRWSPQGMVGFAPSWSPRGDTIAFTGWANGQADIYSVSEPGGAVTNLSRRASTHDAFAEWLPDGSGLVWRSRPPSNDRAYESQAIGSLGILVQTAIMMAMLLLLIGRWSLPFGSLTLIIGTNTALMAVLESEHRMYLVGIAAGLLADLLYRWLRPTLRHPIRLRAFAFLLPFTLWTVYQLMLMADEGLGWSVHMWTGSIVMAGLVGVLMTFLVTGLGNGEDGSAA